MCLVAGWLWAPYAATLFQSRFVDEPVKIQVFTPTNQFVFTNGTTVLKELISYEYIGEEGHGLPHRRIKKRSPSTLFQLR